MTFFVTCYRFVSLETGALAARGCHLQRPCAVTLGMADDMSIDNKPNPPHRDESDDSVDSPLEGDHNASAPASGHSNNPIQDAQQPKRKGGRKPVSLIQLPAPHLLGARRRVPHQTGRRTASSFPSPHTVIGLPLACANTSCCSALRTFRFNTTTNFLSSTTRCPPLIFNFHLIFLYAR